MFTMDTIEEAIGNKDFLERGWKYYRNGRISSLERISLPYSKRAKYVGEVRGSWSYDARFDYDEEADALCDMDCTCAAFENWGSCKHLAAIMLAALDVETYEPELFDEYTELPSKVIRQMSRREDEAQEEKRERERVRREAEIRESARREYEEWQRRQRELAELAIRLNMEKEREERAQFVQTLLDEGDAARRAVAQRGEPVHLYPTLSLEDGVVHLELRVGREKTYVVRNLRDFGQRVARGERFTYGKALTYSHTEGETAQEDVPLLRRLALYGQDGKRTVGNALPLCEEMLDETMSLLVGREVGMKKKNGETALAQVVEGMDKLGIRLWQNVDGYCMLAQMDVVAVGRACAVFFAEGAERIFCAFGDEFRRIAPLLRMSMSYPDGLPLSEQQAHDLCTQVLWPIRNRLELREGAGLIASHMPMNMTPKFMIDSDGKRLICAVRFDYGVAEIAPGESAPDLRRDTFLEKEALRQAEALFPIRRADGEFAFEGSDEECFVLLSERLFALEALGVVLVAERLRQTNVSARRQMVFGVRPESGNLVVESDLGGYSSDELREAYAAYRQKRRFVRLASGMFLSGEALRQAAETQAMLDSLGLTAQELAKGARTPAARAMYLEAALAEREGVKLDAPRELTDWTRRFREAQKTKVEPPRDLHASLREYQKEGLTWLCALSDAGFGGILADDMGLGKTVQALAYLLREKEMGRPVRALIVCPASLQLNWRSETQRFAPTLTAVTLMGTAAQREQALHAIPAPELTIVSYEQLRRDAQSYHGLSFTHVFLDEAQNIKNAASQNAKAVKTIEAQHRFALTGTPIENRLSELWSIFDFLMPGYLHEYKQFKNRFETPIVREGDEEAKRNLRLMTAPFILRRMKKDVLTDLPEKAETLITSELTDEQRRIYAGYAGKLIGELDGGSDRMKILAGLMRLRQICCDPSLFLEGYTGGSGKLEQCVELVREFLLGGHSILIFSQFTSMLSVIERRLNEENIRTFMLTGDTPKQERMDLVQRFNMGEAPVFLISLKAGGTGLNLTGADVVMIYDPWWNTAAERQAVDRAYRIGQTRGVLSVKLVAANTIEERIIDLQRGKDELAEDMLTGSESLANSDPAVLRELLRSV